MINLIIKEFKLAIHPTMLMFLLLSSMVLIPSYPFTIIFFYSCLGIFFYIINTRETKDIYYSMILPIDKKDIVKGKIISIIVTQIIQILLMMFFIIIKNKINPYSNNVGIDANIILLSIGFFIFSIFNYTFLTKYFKNINKIGLPFTISTIFISIIIFISETSTHFVPFVKNILDTTDNVYINIKIIFFIISIIFYIILNIITFNKSVKNFINFDL